LQELAPLGESAVEVEFGCVVLSPRLLTLPALLVLAIPAQAGAGAGGTAAPNPATAVLNGGIAPGQAVTPDGGSRSPFPGGTTPGQAAETPTPPTPPPTTPAQTVPTAAVLLPNGKARAPTNAPVAVKQAIRAGNRLQRKPYRFGGGHQRWEDDAYDCSGSVSYALHGGGVLPYALDSSGLMAWGRPGVGSWITVYANPNHTYVVIAGLRLDTGSPGDRGPRWRTAVRPAGAFVARHPPSL
jgi:hypothetical protein